MYIFLALVLSTSMAFAEIGKITNVLGSSDAHLVRSGQKIFLATDTELEEGDTIFSQSSVVQLHLFPASQISLAKKTQITLTQNLIDDASGVEKTFSVVNFIKGVVRVLVTREADQQVEQKIIADGVSFAVRGTEFEVSETDDDFDLDVIEGEVEVSSPYVQTFVPEMVKAGQGFRFNRKARNFQRRAFGLKFKDHPKFQDRREIREKWLKRRELRRIKGEQRRDRVQDRLERRENRKGSNRPQREGRKR